MKNSRRQFLCTGLAGLAFATYECLSLSPALAQGASAGRQSANVTGFWRGLFVPAKINYDKHIYIKVLPASGPYQIYQARTAFKLSPDSSLFAHRIKEGKYMRIYARAIQTSAGNPT